MAATKPKPPSAADYFPKTMTLTALNAASKRCKGCDLYQHATQTVFGQGADHGGVMFVGEQPGDQEDLAGVPFIGPAGKLLERAMVDAGIARDDVYVTNAVKHFKWEQKGKRRLHSKPSARQVSACRPWLEAEISVVKPRVIICLGATASQALMGLDFKVTKQRGKVLQSRWADHLVATVHPSSLLRIPNESERHKAYAEFVKDLKEAAKLIPSFQRRTSAISE